MKHHYLKAGTNPTHWAANTNARGAVLVQLGDEDGEQVRVAITPEQARILAGQILQSAADADMQLVRLAEDAELQRLRSASAAPAAAASDDLLAWLGRCRLSGWDGEPMIFYHGTDVTEEFDIPHPSAGGAQGPGIYLADRLSQYGTRSIPLYVKMEKPFFFFPSDESLDAKVNGDLIRDVLTAAEAFKVHARLDMKDWKEGVVNVQALLEAYGFDEDLTQEQAKQLLMELDPKDAGTYGTEVYDALKKQGYDGIVMVYPSGKSNIYGVAHEAVIIAFDPAQLRRAGPDILMQPARRPAP